MEAKPDLKGPLPDDFPGRAALADAGITSYGKLRRVDDLTSIAGIGDVTAGEIKAALGESTETEAEIAADVAAGGTTFEAPVAPVKVVCPTCGIGGEVAGAELIGTAVCGDPKHPDTLLVPA